MKVFPKVDENLALRVFISGVIITLAGFIIFTPQIYEQNMRNAFNNESLLAKQNTLEIVNKTGCEWEFTTPSLIEKNMILEEHATRSCH